ncbi:hypothetical protein E0H73_15775 [Kribbella pittospori]|uniref:beta-galactosidase n=2 Tax=Kribbella pittospori TaxID=722689 RepID=A0A4R0KPS0_9ACTN|nr:hypothetical protein E0H73_15775 [Kribbella pittospori]
MQPEEAVPSGVTGETVVSGGVDGEWAGSGGVQVGPVVSGGVDEERAGLSGLRERVGLRGGGERIGLGVGEFERGTGRLVRLGGVEVGGPELDLWRAPTDNDCGQGGRNGVVGEWRAAGLDRLLHRVELVEEPRGERGSGRVEEPRDDRGSGWVGETRGDRGSGRVEGPRGGRGSGRVGDEELVVRARVAPDGLGVGVRATYRWVSVGDGLRLTVEVEPEGEWGGTAVSPRCGSWPRVGVRMAVPSSLDRVRWFGGGPGEAYADSREAARVGRYTSTVDEMQTPYVVPQENGSRIDVRWAELTDAQGNGLRVEGAPYFQLTARRWTAEDLERARHRSDLTPREHIYLNLDLAQNGLGSASCGPPATPQHTLEPGSYTFSLTFHQFGRSAEHAVGRSDA